MMIPGSEDFPVAKAFWAAFLLALSVVPLIKSFGCGLAPARAAHPLQMPFAVSKTHSDKFFGSIHVFRMVIGPIGAFAGSAYAGYLGKASALAHESIAAAPSQPATDLPQCYLSLCAAEPLMCRCAVVLWHSQRVSRVVQFRRVPPLPFRPPERRPARADDLRARRCEESAVEQPDNGGMRRVPSFVFGPTPEMEWTCKEHRGGECQPHGECRLPSHWRLCHCQHNPSLFPF